MSAAVVVVDTVVVVLAAWLPNAAQPPSVPTIAAVAIADFSRAASKRRFDVSLLFMVLSPFVVSKNRNLALIRVM